VTQQEPKKLLGVIWPVERALVATCYFFVSRRITETSTEENVILNRVHVNAEAGLEFFQTFLLRSGCSLKCFFMSSPSLFTALDGVSYHPQIIRDTRGVSLHPTVT